MRPFVLAAVLAVGLPGLAAAQGSGSGRATTPGPTANPTTSNTQPPATVGRGTTAPTSLPPAEVPATPPSGAPPDVVVVPK